MLTREAATTLKIGLPLHVGQIVDHWATYELHESPAVVLEALAEELCTNEELRTFVAGLLRRDG